MLTHWSVAQADSNNEYKWGLKSRWTVPLLLLNTTILYTLEL